MRKNSFLPWAWAIMVPAVSLAAQETNYPISTNSVPPAYYQNLRPPQTASADDPWTSLGIGRGFRAEAQEFGVSLGAGEETRDIGGKKHHDLLLSRLYYGHMLGNPVGLDKWYGGNFEIMPEVFDAWQYYQGNRYLVGATAIVRYNFATGTRWVPYLDAGPGLSLTDIGPPDLGSLGEFNGQIGPGVNYFWRDHVALTLQYRYMHTSNGGIVHPNQGINENIAYVGVSWFF